jgi:hypothetical protein
MWNSYRVKQVIGVAQAVGIMLVFGATMYLAGLGIRSLYANRESLSGLLLCVYPGNTMRFEYKAIEFESDYRIKMITKEGKTMRIVIPPIATCVAAENVEMSVTPSAPSKAPDIST